MTEVDSGNILDTFGFDLNTLYDSDGNESIHWNAVGSVANRGGTPEPSTEVLLLTGLAALGAPHGNSVEDSLKPKQAIDNNGGSRYPGASAFARPASVDLVRSRNLTNS